MGEKSITLKYTAYPKRFLIGVPARDLTAEEVEKYGGAEYLLSSGLWKKVTTKSSSKSAGSKDKSV